MKIFGVDFYEGTKEDLYADVKQRICDKVKTRIAFCDLNMLGEISSNIEFRKKLANFEIVTADGSSVAIINKLFSKSKGLRRIPGPDFFKMFIERNESVSQFLFGSTQITLDLCVNKISKYTNIKTAGFLSPPFEKTFSEATINQLKDTLNTSKPDMLWVSLGCPKQENFIDKYYKSLDASVIAAVGAALDFYATTVKRAPKLFRLLGLEFLYRFIKQPRTVKRIFKGLIRVMVNLKYINKEHY